METEDRRTSVMDENCVATGNEPWRRKWMAVVAQVVSIVMLPFLMPVYATVLVLWGRTLLSLMASTTKWHIAGTVALNTLLVPALFVLGMRIAGFVGDMSISNRRERIIPILVTAACYAICAYMISGMTSAFIVRKFLLAGVGCLLFACVVSLFWKISLHMIAAGGLLAILLTVNIIGWGDMLRPIIVLIACSGLLGSARLYLGHHTPAQVLAGFFGGFAIAAAVLLFFN